MARENLFLLEKLDTQIAREYLFLLEKVDKIISFELLMHLLSKN